MTVNVQKWETDAKTVAVSFNIKFNCSNKIFGSTLMLYTEYTTSSNEHEHEP